MTQKEKALAVSKIPGRFAVFFPCRISLTCYFKALVATSDLPSMRSPRVDIPALRGPKPKAAPAEVGAKPPGEPQLMATASSRLARALIAPPELARALFMVNSQPNGLSPRIFAKRPWPRC